jgi:hypothetical protein
VLTSSPSRGANRPLSAWYASASEVKPGSPPSSSSSGKKWNSEPAGSDVPSPGMGGVKQICPCAFGAVEVSEGDTRVASKQLVRYRSEGRTV